jgi:hypothetical protein
MTDKSLDKSLFWCAITQKQQTDAIELEFKHDSTNQTSLTGPSFGPETAATLCCWKQNGNKTIIGYFNTSGRLTSNCGYFETEQPFFCFRSKAKPSSVIFVFKDQKESSTKSCRIIRHPENTNALSDVSKTLLIDGEVVCKSISNSFFSCFNFVKKY